MKKTICRNMPIGIFDSGIGGLTVVKEIMHVLPAEKIIYLGDTARLPYGNKTSRTIKKFSLANVRFLLRHKVKLIIVACNTSSATSLKTLEGNFPGLPILGVIQPAVRLAIELSPAKSIGVIGTESTISSRAYQKQIRKLDKGIRLWTRACPLLVPLIEEGHLKEKSTFMILKNYLKGIKEKRVDTLILGCTHYPLLKEMIKGIMGKSVVLIDSAQAVAEECKKILEEKGWRRERKARVTHKFYVTDNRQRFMRAGKMFLGKSISQIKEIALPA